LQHRESKADVALAPVIRLQAVRPVELVAHVPGHGLVELCLRLRKLVPNGVRPSFGEERRAVEAHQVLLGLAAHEIRDVHGLGALAEATFEAVRVQKPQEQLEVLLDPAVRGCGHQEEVTRPPRQKLPQPVALGELDFVAEVAR
jgi:hypothetical protein